MRSLHVEIVLFVFMASIAGCLGAPFTTTEHKNKISDTGGSSSSSSTGAGSEGTGGHGSSNGSSSSSTSAPSSSGEGTGGHPSTTTASSSSGTTSSTASSSSSGTTCQTMKCTKNDDCNSPSACIVGACEMGCCTTAPASITTICDDGDPCTHSDHCDGNGICAGTPSLPSYAAQGSSPTAEYPIGTPKGVCLYYALYCSATNMPLNIPPPLSPSGYTSGPSNPAGCDLNTCAGGQCQKNFCKSCNGDCASACP